MNDIDEANEYFDLPDDPEEAFAMLHRKKYKTLEAIWSKNEGVGGWYHERIYVDQLIAFDEVHNLGIFADFMSPHRPIRRLVIFSNGLGVKPRLPPIKY